MFKGAFPLFIKYFVKNNVFVSAILKNSNNIGYSLIMGVQRVNDLPNECSMFVNVTPEMGGIFTNYMASENQIVFKPDFLNFSIKKPIIEICNVPIDINTSSPCAKVNKVN